MPRVLHIEDDPANRLLGRKLLAPAGFEVVDAVDGLDGLKKAREGSYDLILVDIAIPGMDGYEVTLRLRGEATLKDVPIVAITAEGSRNTSLSVGCNGYLQKPIDARAFVRTIEGYLGGQKEGLSYEQSDEHLRAQSQRIVGHLELKLAELTQANERLIELDQARKEFYRNVSHELSTPMTPIVGYTKLLIDQELGPLQPGQLKALRAMSQCVERLRGIIDNLLDVTGIETGKLRFAGAPYLIEEVLSSAQLAVADKLKRKTQTLLVDNRVPAGQQAQGDARRLARALEQLLDNASKFAPAGTNIGLKSWPEADGSLRFAVVDEGPGVERKIAERIFEPFFQGDGSPTRAFGGTGVGLAVARGVARGHGGDVRFLETQPLVSGRSFHGAAFELYVQKHPSFT